MYDSSISIGLATIQMSQPPPPPPPPVSQPSYPAGPPPIPDPPAPQGNVDMYMESHTCSMHQCELTDRADMYDILTNMFNSHAYSKLTNSDKIQC